MINYLKTASPPMYRLYTHFKERPASQPPTEEEIDVAAGKKVLTTAQAKTWFRNLENASSNIRQALEQQAAAASVSLPMCLIVRLLIYYAV